MVRKGSSISKLKPAHMWRAFFERLLGRKNSETHPTEAYVAAFGETFRLAKSEYQFGDRRVIL